MGNETTKWVTDRRDRIQEAERSGIPEVGIFWVLPNGSLLRYSMPWTEAETYGDFRLWGEHFRFWEQVVKRHVPDMRLLEYDQVPRGRLSYDTRRNVFVVYGSRSMIADEKLTQQVRAEFRLGSSHTVDLEADEHYEVGNR